MNKHTSCICALTLVALLMPLNIYAGDILLGDEPSFKGWEGRGGMTRIKNAEPEQAPTKSPEPIKDVEQTTAKDTGAAKLQGPYIGLGGGISMNHDSDLTLDGYSGTGNVEYDLGGGFNLVAGYNFNPIRIEAELGYRVADVDKISWTGGSLSVSGTDLTTKSYMINGYYDVKTGSQITPFIGVGIGMINGEVDVDGDNVDDTVFGYQLTAGITGAINNNVNLDFYYRFQGAAASDFEKYGVNLQYNNSSVFAGIRFNF